VLRSRLQRIDKDIRDFVLFSMICFGGVGLAIRNNDTDPLAIAGFLLALASLVYLNAMFAIERLNNLRRIEGEGKDSQEPPPSL